MPGRRLTGSRPSKILIWAAVYSGGEEETSLTGEDGFLGLAIA